MPDRPSWRSAGYETALSGDYASLAPSGVTASSSSAASRMKRRSGHGHSQARPESFPHWDRTEKESTTLLPPCETQEAESRATHPAPAGGDMSQGHTPPTASDTWQPSYIAQHHDEQSNYLARVSETSL